MSRCPSRLHIKRHAHSVLLVYRVYIYCYWRLTVVSHSKTESWRHLLLFPPFYSLSYTQPLSKKLSVVTSRRWVWSVQDVLRSLQDVLRSPCRCCFAAILVSKSTTLTISALTDCQFILLDGETQVGVKWHTQSQQQDLNVKFLNRRPCTH